jgi:2,4-dienoyl-CoA reductase-like NADH-dependent reductase (Old Yellow Enzyme family)
LTHGYLLQFMSPLSNARTIDRRRPFETASGCCADVVAATRAEMPMGCRCGCVISFRLDQAWIFHADSVLAAAANPAGVNL